MSRSRTSSHLQAPPWRVAGSLPFLTLLSFETCSYFEYLANSKAILSVSVFFVVTPCGLSDTHQRFGGYTVFIFSPEDGGSVFLRNVGGLPTSSHDITTQKTDTDIFKTLRISNLIQRNLFLILCTVVYAVSVDLYRYAVEQQS
jgi:hypothetical protein